MGESFPSGHNSWPSIPPILAVLSQWHSQYVVAAVLEGNWISWICGVLPPLHLTISVKTFESGQAGSLL